jgi:phosphoglycolate phosphatase
MPVDRTKFEAVIFDLDGTLLDTLQDIADSANFALRQLGFPLHSTEEYKYFIGDGIETAVRRILPESNRDARTIARCLELNRVEYRRCWKIHTRPYAGITDMLSELQERKIPMAILSNKPHEFTCEIVAAILGAFDFEVVLGARDGVAVKPDPATAIEIAHKMRIPPGQFLYVGDSGTDMETANAAGMYAVGVLWGFRAADELRRSGAKLLVAEPAEIIALFDGCS